MDITVRHSEPEDYKALHRIFSGPRAIAGTLQMPFPRAETWRERLSEPQEGLYSLVACVEGKVVGSLGLETSPTRWRMRSCRQHRDGRTRRLAGQGHRDGADGSSAGPGRQLAEPHAHRAARLRGQRRRGGVSFRKRLHPWEFQIAAEHPAYLRRAVVV